MKHTVVCKPLSLVVYGENSQNSLASQHVLHLGMYDSGNADIEVCVRQYEEDMDDAFDQHGHCALPDAADC